jgi:hypothetical protein
MRALVAFAEDETCSKTTQSAHTESLRLRPEPFIVVQLTGSYFCKLSYAFRLRDTPRPDLLSTCYPPVFHLIRQE